jgi:hypothetical protein
MIVEYYSILTLTVYNYDLRIIGAWGWGLKEYR